MQTMRNITATRKAQENIRAFEEEKQRKLLQENNDSTYTILLKNGVVLHPHTRARFSKLCYERYNQIRKAFAFLENKTIQVI